MTGQGRRRGSPAGEAVDELLQEVKEQQASGAP